MPNWRLAKSLLKLRNQINAVLGSRPCAASGYFRNRLLNDAIVSGYGSLRFTVCDTLTDLGNISRGQFVVGVGLTVGRVHSSDSLRYGVCADFADARRIAVWGKLHSSIRRIVRMAVATVGSMFIPAPSILLKRDGFKVCGSYATSIAAKVVNLVTSRNRPDPEFVGVSVGDDFTPPSITNNGEVSITSGLFPAAPKPTLIGAGNKTLEAFKFSVRIFRSQGVNLHRQGLALVRPVHSLTRVFGPFCILTQKRSVAYVMAA